jgi:hypothetical protein
MAPTQPRHDDNIIRRRFGEHASTHAVKQIYGVTYPAHTDQGAEHENYGEAEVEEMPQPRSSTGTPSARRSSGPT